MNLFMNGKVLLVFARVPVMVIGCSAGWLEVAGEMLVKLASLRSKVRERFDLGLSQGGALLCPGLRDIAPLGLELAEVKGHSGVVNDSVLPSKKNGQCGDSTLVRIPCRRVRGRCD